MSDNLSSQYDQVATLLERHYEYSRQLVRKLFRPRMYFRILRRFGVQMVKDGFRARGVALRKTDVARDLLTELAGPKERDNQFLKILVSDYPLDALSQDLQRRFPASNFSALAKFHKARSDGRNKVRLSLKGIVAFFLGAGTLILSATPQPVVESLSIDYRQFQIVVFWITVAFVVYSGALVGFALFAEIRFAQKLSFIGEVLDYTNLRLSNTRPGIKGGLRGN